MKKRKKGQRKRGPSRQKHQDQASVLDWKSWPNLEKLAMENDHYPIPIENFELKPYQVHFTLYQSSFTPTVDSTGSVFGASEIFSPISHERLTTCSFCTKSHSTLQEDIVRHVNKSLYCMYSALSKLGEVGSTEEFPNGNPYLWPNADVPGIVDYANYWYAAVQKPCHQDSGYGLHFYLRKYLLYSFNYLIIYDYDFVIELYKALSVLFFVVVIRRYPICEGYIEKWISQLERNRPCTDTLVRFPVEFLVRKESKRESLIRSLTDRNKQLLDILQRIKELEK